jgi:hypothetical protein
MADVFGFEVHDAVKRRWMKRGTYVNGPTSIVKDQVLIHSMTTSLSNGRFAARAPAKMPDLAIRTRDVELRWGYVGFMCL